MYNEFSNIKICGIAGATPSEVEENRLYGNIIGERRTKRQIALTGVETRRISSPRQRTSDLCIASAEKLISHLNWDISEIKVLIFITQTDNYKLPSTAFFIQMRLGIPKDCIAYDINLGCSSFPIGVGTVSSMLQSCEIGTKALLLLGDTSARHGFGNIFPNKADDVAHDMLFGSAGAAIAMERVDSSELYFVGKSDGTGYDAIIQHYNSHTTMNGRKVYEFSTTQVVETVKEFKSFYGIDEKDIDFYVFHQAQKLILDDIARKLGIPKERELRSLDIIGNSSGTSVPISVCRNADRLKEKESVRILFCGFGVGLSWGCIYTEVETRNILPLIECDDHYDGDKNTSYGLGDKRVVILAADTVLGSFLSRYDNFKSANTISIGSNQSEIKRLEIEQYLDHSEIICNTNDENQVVEVIKKEVAKEDKLNGVVIPFLCSREYLESIITCIKESRIEGDVSVVIVCPWENEKKEFQEKTRKLISGLSVDNEDSTIRVNAIIYDGSNARFSSIKKDFIVWRNEYLEDNLAENLRYPFYLASCQMYLLQNGSKHFTENVLAMD